MGGDGSQGGEEALSKRAFKHLIGDSKGQTLLGVAGCCAAGCVVWWLFNANDQARRRRQEDRREGSGQSGVAATAGSHRRARKGVISRAISLSLSPARGRVLAVAICIPAGVCASLYFSRQIHDKYGALASLVMKRKWEGVFDTLYDIGLISFPTVAVDAMLKYLQGRLREELRSNLDRSARDAYLVRADRKTQESLGPDVGARISSDVKELATQLASCYATTAAAAAQLLSRPVLLGMSMGWREFGLLFAYETVVRSVLRKLLPSMSGRARDCADAEGQFSSAVHHVVSHGAEIAVLGGNGAHEQRVLDSLSSDSRAANLALAGAEVVPDTLRSYLSSKFGQLLDFFFMLPAVYYASSAAGTEGQTRTGTGSLRYLTNAVHDLVAVGKSIGAMFSNLGKLERIAGLSQRILELPDAVARSNRIDDGDAGHVEEAPDDISQRTDADSKSQASPRATWREQKGGGVVVTNVTLVETGSNRVLFEDLNLTAKPGERVLLRGDNGVGKTTLLRALSGRCNRDNMTAGSVAMPSASQLYFLPAKNYFAPRSTLLQHLAYPDTEQKLLISRAKSALRQAGLSKLCAEVDSSKWFDAYALSDGEQRRLSLARVFVRKPKYALLDEPLASIQGFDVYERLLRVVPTVLTVSHRRNVGFQRLHTKIVDLTALSYGVRRDDDDDDEKDYDREGSTTGQGAEMASGDEVDGNGEGQDEMADEWSRA